MQLFIMLSLAGTDLGKGNFLIFYAVLVVMNYGMGKMGACGICSWQETGDRIERVISSLTVCSETAASKVGQQPQKYQGGVRYGWVICGFFGIPIWTHKYQNIDEAHQKRGACCMHFLKVLFRFKKKSVSLAYIIFSLLKKSILTRDSTVGKLFPQAETSSVMLRSICICAYKNSLHLCKDPLREENAPSVYRESFNCQKC